MFLIDINDIYDKQDLDEIVTEILEKIIPGELRDKLKGRKNRLLLYDTFGEDAFIDSKYKKFPIINPDTNMIDERLVYAAKIRLIQFIKERNGYLELLNHLNKNYGNYDTFTFEIRLTNGNESFDITLENLVEILS